MQASISICFVLAAVSAQSLAGIQTYNNYGPEWDHNQYGTYMITGPGTSYGLWQQAFDFTPAIGEELTSLVVTLTLGCGYDYVQNTADVFLLGDNNGLPGTVLDSWHFDDALPVYSSGHPRPILVCPGDGTVSLNAGQRYWVGVGTTGDNSVLAWFLNNDSNEKGIWCRNEGSGWNVISSSYTRPVFRVNVVPEPATLSLFATGAFLLLRRKRI